MDQLNFRAPDDLHEAVGAYAREHGVDRSEAARALLSQGVEHERGTSELDRVRSEYEREQAELKRELDSRDARIEELENELRAANRRIDDANDVVEASREMVRVRENERDLQARRAGAGVLTRFKWWVAGDPVAREVGQASADSDTSE